jgi:hypothetical protein
MVQTFNCPSCGASLDYEGSEPVVQCAYCGSAAIVPETLRSEAPGVERPTGVGQVQTGEPIQVQLGDLAGAIANLKTVKRLVAEGRDGEAAQLYRETVGTTRQEAEEAVRRLASGQSVVLSSLGYGSSIPVASGQQVAALVAEQLDDAWRTQQRFSRTVTLVVVGVAVLLVGIIGCAVAVGFLFVQP